MAIAVIAGLAAAVLISPIGRRWLASTPPDPVAVAVLPVDNPTGDVLADAVASGIDARVLGNLRTLTGITLLPRAATAAYDERREDLAGLQRELRAGVVVDLRLTAVDPQPQLAVRVRRTDRAGDLWSRVLAGSQLTIERELLSGLGEAFRAAGAWRRLSDADRARLMKLPTASPEALAEYTQARTLVGRPEIPGNPEKTLGLLKSAIGRDPAFGLAHADLAMAYAGQYQRTSDAAFVKLASHAVNDAVRLAPDDGRVYYALGYVQNITGRREDAVQSLQRAIQVQPDGDDAYRLLGFILGARGDTAAAVTAAERAVAIRPQEWSNHFTLGRVRYDAGDYASAVDSFRRVIELQPAMPRGYLLLGAAFHLTGDIPQAVGNYEHAVRLGPNASAYSNLGVVYYAAGRTADAVTAFQTAVRLDPANPAFHRNLGDARAKAGDRARAAASYRGCVEAGNRQLAGTPRRAPVIATIALCEAKLQRRQDAERHGLEALALAPKDREIVYKNAVIAALFGDRVRALERLREALAQGYQPQLVRQDDDFQPFRGSGEFERILAGRK